VVVGQETDICGSPTGTLEVTLKPVSPDLEVRIGWLALDQAAAQRIADSEWPPDALSVKARGHSSRLPKWLTTKKDQGELFIGAHDILHDKADWNSETWLFAPSAIPRFIATLERLYELLPEQFELVAAWGDKPFREQTVTRTQLVSILSNNTLGNAVRYRVSAG
jgi:hypothetical protein